MVKGVLVFAIKGLEVPVAKVVGPLVGGHVGDDHHGLQDEGERGNSTVTPSRRTVCKDAHCSVCIVDLCSL